MQYSIVSIRASKITDNRNGTFTLEIPSRELTDAERDLIAKLFPNTTDAAYRLLTNETLIGAIATSSEVSAKATGKSKDVYAGKAFDAPIEADRR